MSTAAQHVDHSAIRARLILILTALVVASVLAVGVAAIVAFDSAILPELGNRTRLIGTIIRAEIQRALELGIPIDAIGGLEDYLAATISKFAEVERLAIATASGELVAVAERALAPSLVTESGLGEVVSAQRNSFTLPIIQGNQLVGLIYVDISPLFVQTQLREVFLDVMVLALIATLIALELVLAVIITSVGKPLDRVFRLLRDQSVGDFRQRIRPGGISGLGRAAARLNDHADDLAERFAKLPDKLQKRLDARIAAGKPERLRLSDFGDVRLALFLFSVAAEIAASFMPLYARASVRPSWIDSDVAAALPLIAHLAAIAVIAPFGSKLARRLGPRRLFLASIPCTALALVAMGLSGSLAGITFWRAFMAVFYATATIACQEYVIRASGTRVTARAFTAFIAVIYGGVFTGSALGGLLAGRFSFETALMAGALLALLAGGLAASSMRGRAGDAGPITSPANPKAPSVAESRVFNARFIAIAVGVAVPLNAVTAVFVFYLTPIMLAAGGSGPAEIGRVVMLYALTLVLVAPLAAKLADSRVGPILPIVAGAAGAGIALLTTSLWTEFWVLAASVAGLGIAHSLIRAPLYARALQLSDGLGRSMDALRILERIGAIVGLAACAALLGDLGGGAMAGVLGLVVAVGAVTYAVVEFASQLQGR